MRVLRGGTALRGILAISAGTALAQGLVVAAAPVIARVYTPEEMGLYTVIASATAVLATVASLRWDFAIPIPEDEARAHSLVALALLTVVGSTLTATFLLLLFGREISVAFGEERLMPWLLLVPAVAACQTSMKVLSQLAIRHRRYSSIGMRGVLRSVITIVGQLGLGLAGMRAGGLVVGLALGNAAGAASLLRGSGLRSVDAKEGRRIGALKSTASQFRRFPLLLAPSGLLNVLGLQLPIIIVFALYGTNVAGWLGLTQTVLGLPVALMGQSVAQVYLGELSRANRSAGSNIQALFKKASRHLVAVAAALVLVIMVAAPWFFPIAFGSNWSTSGLYAQALAPALGMQMLAVPLSQTLVVLERQGAQLAWDGTRLASTTGAILLSHACGGSALQTVWVLSAASTVTYLALWWLARDTVARITGPSR